MNTDTKRHIDAARQVLVGVVPNPTSQIDQITYALIYKFMDDMDQAAIKNGDEPAFFTGDLEQYSWARIMDSRIGNQDRMNLYVVAFQKFAEAKQLPELFRNILKSAFLPYRSPETLGLFLKEINYFDYSHPEELGNAYEYLLSIMSSQGDAGQFRTPRHIIDFIVDVVNPTKNDKVLDPACGTGGFLVSSYKHILEQHDGKEDPKKKEKPLTPDERKKLMANFEGYDIDPTMVRIAQVNMYLHQFKNPKIFQYDSLSSEERWNDKFDVVLANPPFMSPKGGIKPHSKFSIQSSRSEVLFVDYIMNHLKPKGRAGIIVPEGIIFQSGTAHKQLRKNLVEDGLYAVVSLPSGVFAPYSGVKTSILLFNNELAKISKDILFIKIESDGFDLGATRRESKFNDLPHAKETIFEYMKYVLEGNQKEVDRVVSENGSLASAVEKSKISESGDYNLSGDRYRVAIDYTNAKWPMVELGEMCEFVGGYAFKSEELKKEKGKQNEFPVIKIGNVDKSGILDISDAQYYEYQDFLKKFLILKDDILIAMTGATVGKVAYSQFDNLLLNQRVGLVRADESKALKSFLKSLLLSEKFYEFCQLQAGGGAQGNISPSQIKKYQIPLPPLEIQKQIVAELDGYAGIVAGAKQIAQNWKPVINIDPSWEQVKFDDYIFFQEGPGIRNWQFTDSGIKLLNVKNISNGEIDLSNSNKHISTEEFEKKYKHFLVEDGDIIIASSGATYGKNAYFKDPGYPVMVNTSNIRLHPKDKKKIIQGYIKLILDSELFKLQIDRLVTGAAQPNFGPHHLKQIVIPLPPIEIQKQIVEKIEAERALVESAKKLIGIYEQKTKETITKLLIE